MNTKGLRKLIVGTFALATLLSTMLIGGSNDAGAVFLKANLVPTNVGIIRGNGPDPCDGPLSIFATVQNTGNKAAGPSVIRINIAGGGNVIMGAPALAPGASATLETAFPQCQSSGVVIVDATNLVAEALGGEDDNTLSWFDFL